MATMRGGLAFEGAAIAVKMIFESEEAKQNMKEAGQAGEELTLKFGSMGTVAKQTSAEMTSFGQAVRTVNSMIVQLSISSFVTFLMLRRLRTTSRSVRDAQDDVNEAMRKHGRFSKEAQDAIQRYKDRMEDVRYAQVEFAMQIAFTSMGMITLMIRIPQLNAALATLKANLFGVAAAGTAANVAMGPLGWALLGIGVGAAVTIGGVYLTGGGGATDFDQQWTEAGSRVKREWQRQRR